MAQVIENGTTAVVHYTGSFPDGEVFDSSDGKDPLAYQVGKQQMIPGFEQEMMGAEIGEKREFTLTPDRAYGENPMMQFNKYLEINSHPKCLSKLE